MWTKWPFMKKITCHIIRFYLYKVQRVLCSKCSTIYIQYAKGTKSRFPLFFLKKDEIGMKTLWRNVRLFSLKQKIFILLINYNLLQYIRNCSNRTTSTYYWRLNRSTVSGLYITLKTLLTKNKWRWTYLVTK